MTNTYNGISSVGTSLDVDDHALSILLPAYNCDCTPLVQALCRQCDAIENLRYEIIIGDDASNDEHTLQQNIMLGKMPNVRCITNKVNLGRAANRNMLAREAAFRWLIFIDGDMMLRRADFISTYLKTRGNNVVYGGYTLGVPPKSGNLRYLYEIRNRDNRNAVRRNRRQWANFHTSNFMVKRGIMLKHPIDENFHRYGYEDVAWGRMLFLADITISHIDNPVSFERYEDNDTFIRKTEEAITTLADMKDALKDFSLLYKIALSIQRRHLNKIVVTLFKCFKKQIINNLKGNNPSLFLFKLYKIGYFLSISK